MSQHQLLIKRLALYVVGLFFLSFGVSLSIAANLGVSPVSSLSYALSLTSGISVGTTTIVTHILYIIIQIILTKSFDLKNALIQLGIAFLFGFFIDTSLVLIGAMLPIATNLFVKLLYMIVSFFLVGGGLFIYSAAKYTLMPYDELTKTISSVYQMPFGKAKIIGDVANVIVAAAICLILLRSFGSIGVGTVLASLLIGRILGMFQTHFQKPLDDWLENVAATEHDHPAV